MGHDLASSTEQSLCEELAKTGHSVTLISPGQLNPVGYYHHEIKDVRLPGLTSITGSMAALKLVKKMNLDKFDLVLVDWRYIFSHFQKRDFQNRPWMIIDRGPPTHRGFLNGLQKKQWKKAWTIASEEAVGGFVVSRKHADFVEGVANVNVPLFALPAGSKPNPNKLDKPNMSDILILSYVGQLDERRDVKSIIALSEGLSKENIMHRIDVCGSGDSQSLFEDSSKSMDGISFHGIVSNDRMFKLLSESHVGIMPMPDIPVWRISSTLKLANYLASGLIIIGPKHPGNGSMITGDWNFLQKQDWIEKSVFLLSDMVKNHQEFSGTSRLGDLSWGIIAQSMVEVIEKIT